MKNKKTNSCFCALSVGMKFGPIVIPKEHQVSEKTAIEYVLEQMKDYIRDMAVFRFDEKGNKKITMFLQNKDEKSNKQF